MDLLAEKRITIFDLDESAAKGEVESARKRFNENYKSRSDTLRKRFEMKKVGRKSANKMWPRPLFPLFLLFLLCLIPFGLKAAFCRAEGSDPNQTITCVDEKNDTYSPPSTHFEWNEGSSESYPIPKQIRYSLSIQNLENTFGKNIKLWMYGPSLKTSHQVLTNLSTSYPAQVLQDDEGNIICAFSVPEIAPYETIIFRLRADLGMSETPQAMLLDDPGKYLLPERLIESDQPSIQEKALKFKKEDTYESAKSIYQWVADTIKNTALLSEDRGALYALTHLEGDCTESAALFAALCRAIDIPARMLCGYICPRNCIVNATDFHHWAEFYHHGAWHVVDPQNRRFDQDGENYMVTEIFREDHENPVGAYHRYRFEGEGVRFKVKMID